MTAWTPCPVCGNGYDATASEMDVHARAEWLLAALNHKGPIATPNEWTLHQAVMQYLLNARAIQAMEEIRNK